MEHDHSQHHHHHHEVTNVTKAFIIGIVLNILFVATELIIGFKQSSLALISDSLHNLMDVFSLLFSLFAFKMMNVKATESYSYGYKKISILASLFNAVFLIITTLIIFYEGFVRLKHPQIIDGRIVSVVAFVGIFINGISAYLFFKDKEKDLNIKGAYLHLLSDALVSLGVVIGGIFIYFTEWYMLDVVLSFIIGIVILVTTWNLLNDSVRAALDGTPRNVDLHKVKEVTMHFPEIMNIHHIHVWAISSSENAMTAHLVLRENNMLMFEKIKQALKHELKHLHIHHTTFELESETCEEEC